MAESISLPIVPAAASVGNAVATVRMVGGTTDGYPTQGDFNIGDYVVSQTGKIYVCTGTPTAWTQVGGNGLPSSIEYYTNSNLSWPAEMYTTGASPGNKTLWKLNNLPTGLSAGTTNSITVYNTSITNTSMFFITPMVNDYMGGPLIHVWTGLRSAGNYITFHVSNTSSGTFSYSWGLQVLMVQAS